MMHETPTTTIMPMMMMMMFFLILVYSTPFASLRTHPRGSNFSSCSTSFILKCEHGDGPQPTRAHPIPHGGCAYCGTNGGGARLLSDMCVCACTSLPLVFIFKPPNWNATCRSIRAPHVTSEASVHVPDGGNSVGRAFAVGGSFSAGWRCTPSVVLFCPPRHFRMGYMAAPGG